MSGWSQEQMDNWRDPMLAGTGFNRPGVKPRQEAQILTQPNFQNPQQTGLGGLMGNKNLGLWRDQLFGQGGNHPLINTRGGGQHPFIQKPPRGRPYRPYGGPPGRPGYQPSLDDFGPPRGTPFQPIKQEPQYDVAGGFEEFGETLGGYKETLGGYGEQLGGFGETLGGYGEQISGFEEQLGGFGEQFSGIQEQVGGVGEDINEINERLGGIEEGISTLKISKPEQKQNPYSNMFNPFSFIGNWGGSRSRMSYR